MRLTEITTKLNDDKISDTGKKFLDTHKITNYTVREDGLIDVTGSVLLVHASFTELPVKFGRVSGSFAYHKCRNLTSLNGTPTEVGGSFDCSVCTSLTSLNGAPNSVGGSFDCSVCTSLTSLNGAPTSVGGDFDCSLCTNLTSLEGAPTEVGGSFDCSVCTSLTSLNGAPTSVGGDFDCSGCTSLTSLIYLPKQINGQLRIMNVPKVKNYLMIIKTYGITVILTTGHKNLNKILTKYLQPLNSKKVPDIIGCQDELIEAGLEEYARTK
jgi:hypothetical protein